MNLEALLRDQNQQWFDPRFRPQETTWFHRPYYPEILRWLEKDLIISLTGLRRVGKSTLIKQILGHLLNKSITPRNLFYFSFDRSIVKNEPDTLRQILETYATSYLHTPLSVTDTSTFIFLDEIQIIPYWQDIIKTYYDTAKNVKFILSGSSSLFIRKRSTESLAGRLKEIAIMPLTFAEYLKLDQKAHKEIYENDFRGDKLDKYSHFFPEYMATFFEKYLRIGQFPQPVIHQYGQAEANEYLETIQDKIIEIDLPQTFPIKRPDILKIIFAYLKEHSGNLLLYDNLSRDLGVDIRTTRAYIDWLKKAFLIDLCHNQTKKIAKSSRTAKKVYLTSTNFSQQSSLGNLVETYVYSFLKQLPVPVEFFRFQNHEVDFVTTTHGGMKVPWEVKYSDRITPDDEKELVQFIKHHQAPFAFLITKSAERESANKSNIYHIPAAKLEMEKKALLRKLLLN